MNALIFDIQRFSIYDGDGIRTTVFFKGCPLDCMWCHNPESKNRDIQLMYYSGMCTGCGKCLTVCEAREKDGNIKFDRTKCKVCGECVKVCPYKANKIVGYYLDTKEIFNTVMRDRAYYGENGGMTLSGGEPSLQSDCAIELIDLANENGISTVVETCGFGKRDFFRLANEKGVTFYFDLKAIDPEKHKKLTGRDNGIILANLEFLFSQGAKVVLRLPLIPGVNDSDGDLMLLREFLEKNRDKYIRADIMKYHILGKPKAFALGKEYNAPLENADGRAVKRWFTLLDGEKNKVVCE